MNYDAQFNSDPDAENRNKIPGLVFEKKLFMLAV